MYSEIHKHLHSIWNKEEIPHRGNNLSLYPFSRKAIGNIVVMIKTFFVIKYIQTFIQHPSCQGYLHMHKKLLGTVSVDLDVTDQLLIIFCIRRILEKS